MSYDPGNTIVRIIDKTNNTPTGITEGGLIDGDLLGPDHVARIVREEGDGKTPNLTLMLYIPTDGMFVRSAPILIDKEAPDKYLIEVQIAQDGNNDKLQRYRLSTPTITDDPDLGEILSVPCESIAFEALKESLVSINDELVNPNQRVTNILTAWNGSPGTDRVLLTFDAVDIDVPDSDALAFDYTPTTPKSVDFLIQDVISRLKEAGPLGGVFKNFYYRTEADPIFTRAVKFKIEEFGKNDSGVIIDPDNAQAATLEDRVALTSNKRRKKVIVVKYNVKSGSLPTEHAEFRSEFLHAKFREEWDVSKNYLEGEVVKWTDTSESPNIIRFFTASSDVSSGGNDPNTDNFNWFEDFTLIPEWNVDMFNKAGEVVTVETGGAINFFKADVDTGPSATPPNLSVDWTSIMLARPASTYQGFFSPSPWTSNLENFKTNIDGTATPPATYVGVCVDWNFARILNDIPDYTNRFQIVTGKDVRDILNTPPGAGDRRRYNGVRYLVGTSPTDEFVGHENQVAERVSDIQKGIIGEWRFSLDPIDGDVIYDHKTGFVFGYDGISWNTIYTVTGQSDKPGPIHAVKDIELVKDASEIPGQAIQLRYDWKELIEGGNNINRTSRGAWIAFYYPTPIEDADVNLGGLYGGNGTGSPSYPFLNHINLDRARDGLVGWNNGKISESQGRISEHSFKIRLGFFRSTDDSVLSKGKANIKCTYWRKDNIGRFFFHDFTIPENNGWNPVKISLPPFGTTNLYFSRLDELYDLLGFTLPFDFFIPEKEFSGVKYEFRKNQAWGVFMKDGAYNDTGLYINNYPDILEGFLESGTQLVGDTLEALENAANALLGIPVNDLSFLTETSTIDHTKIAICELHYNKEGYAIFPETTNDDPRYQLVRLENETDYLTAKAKAESTFNENDFFPNERHVGCFGDVQIRYGELITESGDRVPGGSLESVVALKKDTIDNRGFKQELFLVRKFEIE